MSFGNFKSLLSLVKEFIVNAWEVRKQKLYGDDSCPNQLRPQSSPGGLGGAAGVEGKGMVSSGDVSCIVCYACGVSVGACNVYVHVSVIMCILVWIDVHVCVAPPILVGKWPMVGLLFEYYYYYYHNVYRTGKPGTLHGFCTHQAGTAYTL